MKNKRFMLAGSDKQHKDDDDEREDNTRTSLVACFAKERCPICLNFLRKDVAYPENCYHAFCFTCILKWSETSTSCPVDRKPFHAVIKIDKVVGCTKIPVKVKTTQSTERYCCDRKQCCSFGIENDNISFRIDTAKEIPVHNCKSSTSEKKRSLAEEKTDLKLKIKRLSWSSACCSGGFSDMYPPAHLPDTPNHVTSGSYFSHDSEINLIQKKRDELRYFRTPAVARQAQCNTPLSTETETLILPLPSFTFFDHIFPLNHFSARNKDFSKRTCAHSGAQEGTEKKRAAGASSTRGTRKKPVQSSTRRRSTRNSKIEDDSQLQSSPKSSNSDHSATGCNSSSTNAESSEKVVKPPPKQRKKTSKKRSQVRKRLRSNTRAQEESDESKENSGSESEQSYQKKPKTSMESSSDMGHTDTDTSADHVADMCEHQIDEQSSDIPVSDTDKQFDEQHSSLSPQIQSSDKIQHSPDFQNEDSFDKDIASSPGLNNGQHLGSVPDSPPSAEHIVLSETDSQLDAAGNISLCSEENNYPGTQETEKPQDLQTSDFASEQSDGEDLEHNTHSKSLSASETFLESENAAGLPLMSMEKCHQLEENDSADYIEDRLQCEKDESDGNPSSVTDSHSIVNKPSDFPVSHNGHNSPPSLESTVVSQIDEEFLCFSASEKREQSKVGNFADILLKEQSVALEATCESSVSEMESCSESLLQNKLLPTKEDDDTAGGFSEHKECFGEEASTASLQEHKEKPNFVSINVTDLPEQSNFAQMHVKVDDCEKPVNVGMESSTRMHENFESTINTGVDLESHKLSVNENGDKSDLNPEQEYFCKNDKSACDFVSEKQCEMDSIQDVMDKETLKSESDSQVSEKEEKSNIQKTESKEINEKLKKETRTRKSRFHSPSTTWSPSKTDLKDRPRSRSRSRARDSPAKRRSRSRSRDRERDRGGQWKGRSRDRRHRRQSRSRSKSRSRSRSGSRPRNRNRFSASDRNNDSHSPHWKDRRSHENWRGSRGHERYRRSDNEKPNEHLRRNEQYKSNEYSRRNDQAKSNEHLHRSETEKRWNEAEKHGDHFRRNESEKTAENYQLNELEQNNDHFPKNKAEVPSDHSQPKELEKSTKHLMHNEPQKPSEHILQNEPDNHSNTLRQDESDRPSIPFQKNPSEKPNDCFQQEPEKRSNSFWQTEPKQHNDSVQSDEPEKTNFFHRNEPEKSGNHFQRSEHERPSNSFWRNEHDKSSDHCRWNESEQNRSNFWRNEPEKPDNHYWPNEPDEPNEQFRDEKQNMNRERSEQYPGNKNHYPDWVAENNKPSEKRGRGANRSRGYTRGSSWSDNQYRSGDSWNRNINSEWRAPRGRGGRGRGGFRGGLSCGDQNENHWNSRQPFSGNFGPEPSGLTEKNFRPKYEPEPPNPPADRSGWSSASSWAVRKTLPADVQSYYSKRGKSNAGPQPGWSRQEVSQDQDQTIKEPASQQSEASQVSLPMHLHPGLPIVQVTASTTVPQGLPPPPPPPPPTQQINYIASQQDGKHLQGNPSASHVSSNLSAPLLPAPTAPQGIAGTMLGPNSGSVATSSYPVKVSARKESITVEATADSSKKEKRLQMQERAAQEVKIAIKPFYQNKDITKEEYKEIVKKAVDKVCHSKSGEVDSSKVANLVKAYVDKYKHSRKKGD
uniref:SR-related CTD-associated factor 11 n=1 Tax=Xenopus tropicalis TaxID=8364 RepID=A0A6I8RIR2_XENTR